jgi:hypothetical protein
MTSRALKVSCGLLLLAMSACQTSKSSTPTAPTVAGPIAGVTISAPVLLSPAQGFKFKESEQPIQLVVQNATTNGVRTLTYTFEVAADAGFTSKVFSRSSIAQGDGKTSVTLDRLEIGRAYYWRAWAEDGANTGTAASAGFEIYPKAAINPPTPISPANGSLVSSTTPTIVVGNAATVGPVGFIAYEFYVANDQAFTSLVAAGIVNEGTGQTTFTSSPLANNATFYWRVRAKDHDTTSGWAPTQSFKTPPAPAPSPSPSPSPSPAPGGACNSSSPLSIIQCERAKYGHMSTNDTVNFLISSARSLTANGISGGPFGLLRKSGGSSCNGYSCDIICSGSGNGQKQWDVLGDAEGAQVPSWSGPNTVPNIRVDVCEIK